jgi:hypothetical protein
MSPLRVQSPGVGRCHYWLPSYTEEAEARKIQMHSIDFETTDPGRFGFYYLLYIHIHMNFYDCLIGIEQTANGKGSRGTEMDRERFNFILYLDTT